MSCRGIYFVLVHCAVIGFSDISAEHIVSAFRVTELFQIGGEVACNKEVCHLRRTV